jgi:DNA-binding response OmpR family regulator
MSARILVVDDSPTIRKVVGSILSAREYEPILAEDGQNALEVLEREKVDLVLLDFVMPRMNGYQFCRELRANAELKNLPVVLMSAKGDKIRGHFVEQTGAIDAITKPFDAAGLVAVVEGALKKHEEGRAGPVPDAEAMPVNEDSFIDNLRPSNANLSDDPEVRRVQASREFAAALSRVISSELKKSKAPPGTEQVLAKALDRAIRPETMSALSTLLQALSFGENTREVLAGDLSVISIAEILQLLDLQRQSGTLGVYSRDAEISLTIRDGRVDFGSSRGLSEEFLIGRYFVEERAITKNQLKQVLEGRSGVKRLLGESLVALGFVTEAVVKKALVEQTSELIYEVVRWRAGRFTFTVGAPLPAAAKASLHMETSALVMEGFRRVDEWRLIEGSFDFDDVLFPDPVAIERLGEEANLKGEERTVLSAIDGEKTIREIVNAATGSSFEVCKILYQLLNSRLVRRKAPLSSTER